MTVSLPEFADFRSLPGKERLFQLLAPFSGSIDGCPFTVPQWFVTDLASVPRIFESVISNNAPDILRAAILHDWLYQNQGRIPEQKLQFTRRESDMILREGMRSVGATWRRRWLVWISVRVGGKVPWNTARIRRPLLAMKFTHWLHTEHPAFKK